MSSPAVPSESIATTDSKKADTSTSGPVYPEVTPLTDTVDPTCSILVIAPSIEDGVGLVGRIKGLARPASSVVVEGEPQPKPLAGPIPTHIPWTISNKYYTAPVHFVVHTFGSVTAAPSHVKEIFSGAPAVVYVWAAIDAYAKQVGILQRMIAQAGYDPEVCLAVRVAHLTTPGETPADKEKDTDEEDVDTKLMELGFEYVDARGDVPPRRIGDVDEEEEVTPHLPRVLDALSTIMWASMESSHVTSKEGGRREQDLMIAELLSEEDREGYEPLASAGATEPLTEEAFVAERDRLKRPWGSTTEWTDSFPSLVASPVVGNSAPFECGTTTEPNTVRPETGLGLGFGMHSAGSGQRKVTLGFEDNFVVEEGYVNLSDEEEGELPSQEEIDTMRGRIFGGGNSESGGDFDLGSVVAALEEIKGEIASMESGERRNAAARVALGLVYSLDSNR